MFFAIVWRNTPGDVEAKATAVAKALGMEDAELTSFVTHVKAKPPKDETAFGKSVVLGEYDEP